MTNKLKICRICGEQNKLETIIGFGDTPLANSYVTKENLDKKDDKFDLSYSFCKTCGAFQLNEIVDPNILFKNYLYASSTSNSLVEYFKSYCNNVIQRFNLKEKGKFVTVIASNDGVELRNFVKEGIDCIGVEPASNLARVANNNGIPTIDGFFNKEMASRLLISCGKSDLIMFNNVAAHIPNIHEFFEAVKMILKEDGIIVFENFSLLNMLQNNVFDICYLEHIFQHSCFNLGYFLYSIGLEIFDWENEDKEPHNGYFRCFAQFRNGKQKISDNVRIQKTNEFKEGLHKIDYYKNWTKNLEKIGHNLSNFIKKEKSLGKTFCAYGYPAKATTLCLFFDIGNEFKYAVDDSPLKKDLYTPGYHVPIVSNQYFKENTCDYTIVLAWNFFDSIVKNNPEYKGTWINPFKI